MWRADVPEVFQNKNKCAKTRNQCHGAGDQRGAVLPRVPAHCPAVGRSRSRQEQRQTRVQDLFIAGRPKGYSAIVFSIYMPWVDWEMVEVVSGGGGLGEPCVCVCVRVCVCVCVRVCVRV